MNKKQLIVVWKMRPLSLSILILLLTSSIASADLKSYFEDLDNDGNVETVTVHQKYDTFDNMPPLAIEGIVTVYDPDIEKAMSFSMPDRMGEVQIISLNKDGFKQIVAWFQGGAHYTNLAIYGLRNNRLYKIFENGSACGIETDFAATPPVIKVGIARLDKKGWSYADEPDWEVWVWDGKKFNK